MLTRFETELASIFDGVGDAGSPTDIERVVLRDGSSVVIRPLAAGDEAAIASWFAGLGAETRYARFFVVLERLDRRTQSELARVDHFNHEAIAAVASRRKHGRNRALPTHRQAQERRGRGRGGRRLAGRASPACCSNGSQPGRARPGIEQFIAICLASNHAVIRLLSRLGPTTVGPSDAGVVELRIDLNEHTSRSLTLRRRASGGGATERRSCDV